MSNDRFQCGCGEDEYHQAQSDQDNYNTLGNAPSPHSDIQSYDSSMVCSASFDSTQDYYNATGTTFQAEAPEHFNIGLMLPQQVCRLEPILNVYPSGVEIISNQGYEPPCAMPTVPDPVPAVNRESVGTTSDVGYNCGPICDGIFLGDHQCIQRENFPGSLSVICMGNSNISCRFTFSTRTGFNRHWKQKHRNQRFSDRRKVSCPFEGCKRVGESGFTRPDNLRQHRRSVHGENIPKEKRMFSGVGTRHGRD